MIAAAAIFPAVSLPATRTTTPSKYLLIVFLITDKGIKVGKWGSTPNHDSMVPVPETIARGDIMTINVLNLSKTTMTFALFGKKTPPIKPGGKGHLRQIAMVRGSFRWTTTAGATVVHHGYITVA